jgi:hypothetical protein
MLTSTHARRVPRIVMPPPAVATGFPLDVTGPVEAEEHIIVLGGSGPELMCALLRAGAANVTHLQAHERPPAATASLVIVPWLPSLDWLAASLTAIRRALLPGCRLVLRAGRGRGSQTEIRRILALHGMTATLLKSGPDDIAIRAALSPFRVV